MADRGGERESRGVRRQRDALAHDRAAEQQLVCHPGTLLELQTGRIGALGRAAGATVRDGSQDRLIGRMMPGRKFIKSMEDHLDFPGDDDVVKKCRSLVNARRSRIAGRRHIRSCKQQDL